MGIIGIDLGTTGCRAILYDDLFGQVSEDYREYPIITPRPGWAEQDAGLWWSLAAGAVRSVVSKAGPHAFPIKAVGISSQSISFVPVNENADPLANAISWLDVRAEEEMTEVLESIEEKALFKLTGKRASAAYTLPKLIWFAKNKPDVLAACSHILLPHDFLVAKLTGEAVTDRTLASGTMMYDLEGAGWSDEILEKFGLPGEKLPVFRENRIAGFLTEKAAAEMGLAPGTPVAVGGQDQKCAAYAAGLAEGTATVSLGTAAAVTVLETAGQITGECDLPRFAFFSPGVFIREGSVGTAGMALRWLRDVMRPDMDYSAFTGLAEPLRGKSEVMFFPHLAGSSYPDWNAKARGSFRGLSLSSSAGDMVLAVMESIAFDIRRIVTAAGSEPPKKLSVFGGGAKSPVWRQIIADATGVAVESAPTHEMACLGAALLAGEAVGAAVPEKGRASAASETLRPEAALSGYYNDKYDEYINISLREAARQYQ